jgi:uncharacterized protein YbjT (DUF2867 family)
MTLLVVGATGTLGRQVVRRALDEGYTVRCLVRSPRKGDFLKQWGAELVKANLCNPETLPPALEGVTQIIDAATTRPTDSLSIKQVDWEGKVALIQAACQAGVERYVFFSMLNAAQYPHVPLMHIKTCTEKFLAESGLNYTVIQLSGFLQGLISEYAVPILEGQAVWVTGEATPVAYMDTQDIARIALRTLEVPETIGMTFPAVGNRAWGGYEIIRLCERLSEQEAKISRMPVETLRLVRRVARFFEWGWNFADRLAFTETWTTGSPLTADMAPVYARLGLDPKETTTLEGYLQEYFDRILKSLKALDYNKEKNKKKKVPF